MGGALQKSPVPPGAYVEVDVANINEGLFIAEVNAKMRKALGDLFVYEQGTGDRTGQIEVTAKIKVGRMANTRDLISITTKVTSKIPEPETTSEAKESGGKLLCQPVGTNDDAEQQLLYDGRGNLIGTDGRPRIVEQDDREPLKMPRSAQI